MADRIVLTVSSELFDDDPTQEASVRVNVSIRSLIAEVRREFNLPEGNYSLTLKDGEQPLAFDQTLEQLKIQTGAELIFERERRGLSQMIVTRGGSIFQAITSDTRALLRAEETGTLFEIEWQPAIIGRPSANQPGSANALAVNLGDQPEGRSVSRQHARITERGDQYFLESMAERNPTFLNDEELVVGEKRRLSPGDVIQVGKIRLAFETQHA